MLATRLLAGLLLLGSGSCAGYHQDIKGPGEAKPAKISLQVSSSAPQIRVGEEPLLELF